MILAFAGQKGGVGKSTCAVSVACEELSRGLSVLLVDADPQATARTFCEVATEAGHPCPTVVAMGETMHRADQLPKVGQPFDLVVIDCPPRADNVQRSALMVADLVVLPCGPSAADAWALAASLEVVTSAQIVRPKLRAVVLITRKQARTAVGQGAREALKASGLPILETELGYRVAYQEALAAGLGVTAYAPDEPAADEVRALCKELETIGKKAARHARKA